MQIIFTSFLPRKLPECTVKGPKLAKKGIFLSKQHTYLIFFGIILFYNFLYNFLMRSFWYIALLEAMLGEQNIVKKWPFLQFLFNIIHGSITNKSKTIDFLHSTFL